MVITLGTVVVTILLLVLSIFFPDVFAFVEKARLFEILVLTLLIEIVYHAAKPSENTSIRIFANDSEAQQTLSNLIDSGQIRSAEILATGLTARHLLIAKMANHGIPVKVLVQHPSAAIGKADADRLPTMIDKINDQIIDAKLKQNISIKYAVNSSTLRAVILYGRNEVPIAALVGWYTYQNSNTTIVAAPWPEIWALSTSAQGRLLIDYAQLQFNRQLNEAKDELT
ncbi:MAG TPA: hypothetical protein VJ183_17415 [Chloroflexia bacterium]|nr:hypothetical protein [Chloroflexia bacterium]